MNQLLAANWQESYGPYAYWLAADAALHEAGYEPQRVVVIYTHANEHQPLLEANSIFSMPNQAIDLGVGLITANPALKVIVSILASDLYGPLWPPLLLASADNHNITILVQNNLSDPNTANIGLQAILTSLNCWLARSMVSDPQQTSHLLQQGLKHDGLSILEVITPTSDDHKASYQAVRSQLFNIQPTTSAGRSWPANDKNKAWHLLDQAGQRLDVGLIYIGTTPSYQKRLLRKYEKPLVDRPLKIELKRLWDALDN